MAFLDMPEGGGGVYRGYAYRTSARFGGYVEMRVTDGTLKITGMRIHRGRRVVWLVTQSVFLWASAGCLIAWPLTGQPLLGWAALVLFAAEYAIAGLGALLLWWPADRAPGSFATPRDPRKADAWLERLRLRYVTLDVPLAAVARVSRTRWYARRGLWIAALPWVAGNCVGRASHREIVFEFPDPDRPGRWLVLAPLMSSAQAADELQAILTDVPVPSRAVGATPPTSRGVVAGR